MYVYTYTYACIATINEKEATNLKESTEGQMGVFEGRKRGGDVITS